MKKSLALSTFVPFGAIFDERIGILKHPSELNQYAWVDTLKNEQNNIVLEHETQGDVSFDLPMIHS